MGATKPGTVQEAIARAGDAVTFLRDYTTRSQALPLIAEHTSWQSEQRAWRESVALMDQSHHMTDLFLRGPDAVRLLSDLAVNTFSNFTPNSAKQLLVCSPGGYYIGDGIAFHLPDGTINIVCREIVAAWIQYHLEVGEYQVTAERDENSAVRADGPPVFYRYELQGPNAQPVMERLLGETVAPMRFFSMTTLTIAGHDVNTLRHGMAGQPGYELFGPWQDRGDVLKAIVTAGEGLDMRQVGGKAYSTSNLESGWIPPTLPAIFSDDTRAFREWVTVPNIGGLAGSLLFDDVADYYLTPFDLGYKHLVAFDHDFVGREALESHAARPARHKVTLVWDPADLGRAYASLFDPSLATAKLITLPKARYGLWQKDAVEVDGQLVGVSMDAGYIANEQAFVSLASIDGEYAQPGTRVTVVWGENPVSGKTDVEPHTQIRINATVAPVPFSRSAREHYRTDRDN